MFIQCMLLLFLLRFCLTFVYCFYFKGMNTLIGYDLVPEAKILDSALRACRRLNDLASAIRILEAVKVSILVTWIHALGACKDMLWYFLLRHFQERVILFSCSLADDKLLTCYWLFCAGKSRTPQRNLSLPDPGAEAHPGRTRHLNAWRVGHGQIIDCLGEAALHPLLQYVSDEWCDEYREQYGCLLSY